MSWYYLNEAGEVTGPLLEETLRELHAIGHLAATTQVCREGSEDWISLAEALGTFTATPAGSGESVLPSAAPTVINTLPQSHQTPGSQLNVQHAARQVRFQGRGTTPQVTPPQSTGKKWALILGAIAVFAAVVAFVFLSKPKRSSPDLVSTQKSEAEQKKSKQQVPLPKVFEKNEKLSDARGKALANEQRETPEAKTDSEKYLIKLEPARKGAVLETEIEGQPVNGYYIYFRKGEAKPFTGYAKSEDVLWRLMDGVVQEHWDLGSFFPLHLRHAIYRNPKQGESLRRKDFDKYQGVVSVKVWTPTGEQCRDTNVEDGNGKEILYWERIEGESADKARPTHMMKYTHGKKTLIWLPAKAKPPQSKSIDLMASEDFDMGFRAGAIGSNLPFTNREAYLEGRQFGEKAKSMPAYTQGYNQGREHGIQKITRRSNPFNKISQKVEWLAWDHGYSIGNLEGQLSR